MMAPDCDSYRDRPGETEVVIVIRNERSEPIYLEGSGCDDDAAPLQLAFVDRSRPVEREALLSCGSARCQNAQDEGVISGESCLDDEFCQPRRLRLEPGAEFVANRFRSEVVSFGDTVDTRMPEACFERLDPEPSDEFNPPLPGLDCSALRPLDGSYEARARASVGLNCSSDDPIEPCDCEPTQSGTCLTNEQTGTGESLDASVVFAMPTERVVIVFGAPGEP